MNGKREGGWKGGREDGKEGGRTGRWEREGRRKRGRRAKGRLLSILSLQLTAFLFEYISYITHFAVPEGGEKQAILGWKIPDLAHDCRHNLTGALA